MTWRPTQLVRDHERRSIKIEVDDKRHAAWFETVAAASTSISGDSCSSDKPCAAVKFKMHVSGSRSTRAVGRSR